MTCFQLKLLVYKYYTFKKIIIKTYKNKWIIICLREIKDIFNLKLTFNIW